MIPRIRSIVETVLYVEDLDRSVEFYGSLLDARNVRGGFGGWADLLAAVGEKVESRVDWPRPRIIFDDGGKSLFLRDPDGHLVELITPGTWANY